MSGLVIPCGSIFSLLGSRSNLFIVVWKGSAGVTLIISLRARARRLVPKLKYVDIAKLK